MEKNFWSFVYVSIHCVSAGITTLMSTSDGLDLHFFRRKMEKTRFMEEQMAVELFFSRHSWYFFITDEMITFSLLVLWVGV